MKITLFARETTFRILLCVSSLLVNLAFPQISRASVFTSSVSVHSYTSGGPSNQPSCEIDTWTDPNSSGQGAHLWMTVNTNLVLSPYSYTIGIGHKWFDVDYGTVFNLSYVSTATPFASNLAPPFTPPGRIQLSPGQDFYLAFWHQWYPYRFGWAHLKYNSSGLITLLGNAIEDTGSGIIVGTTTVVPEPTTIGLVIVGLLGVWAIRRRK